MIKKLFLGTVGIFSLALLLSMGSPQTADAYEFYSDATNDVGQCGQCHTGFRDNRDYASAAEHNDGDTGICTKSGDTCTVDADCPAGESCGLAWGDSLHNIHRAFTDLGNDCDFCHGGNDSNGIPVSGSQVAIGSSLVAADGVNALGCSGCHVQAGLVLHHNANGITECVGCHPGLTSAPEDTLPPWYGSITITPPGTLMDPCNFNLAEDFSKDPALLGLDNDGDNLYDTADPDCSPEICDDGADNNGNGLIDCADPQCNGQTGPNGEICEFGTELTCDDTFDNDADTLADCADQDCDTLDGGGFTCEFGMEMSCFDTFDNDADGATDCVDNDCDGATQGPNSCTVAGQQGECAKGELQCVTGAETCVQTIDPLPAEDCLITGEDNDCDGLLPADDPDCAGVEDCFNGVDDDGDLLVDCADPDCEGAVGPGTTCGLGECAGNTGNLTCTGGVEVDTCDPLAGAAPDDSLCNGLDDDCDGPIDEDYVIDDTCGIGVCGAPNNTPSSCVGGSETPCAPGPEGVEGPEGDATCGDGADNDCDGATDGADIDCGAQPAAPPVNQELGFLDTALATSGLERADCLNEAAGCHAEAGIEDRHHLLYNSEIPVPSVIPYIALATDYDPPGAPFFYNCQGCHSNDPAGPIVELECMNCHGTYSDGSPAGSPHHTTTAALAGNCQFCHGDLVDNIGLCSVSDTPCQVDTDCPGGETCNIAGSGVCKNAADPPSSSNTVCEDDIECTLPDETCDKTHYIPTYDPSLVTPTRSQGDADQINSYGNGAGACNYCHDSDVPNGGSGTGTLILSNEDTHHGTSLYDAGKCIWCHDTSSGPGPMPFDEQIRVCENCHGPDSLHNIQADSNGDGVIDIGGELAGYGHVGRDQGPNDSDCWGCHGFGGIAGAAPGSGPLNPTIGGIDLSTMTAGTDTAVVLSGAAFTNIDGAVSFVSDVSLTGADGSSVTLTPSSISQGSLTVTIPGATAVGNIELRAVKAGSASNPVVVSVVPEVSISGTTCVDDGAATVTINGGGFSGYQAGATSVTGTVATQGTDCSPYTNKKTCNRQDGCQWDNGASQCVSGSSGGGTETGAVSAWSDSQITAGFSACPDDVAVNSVYGSATSDVGGGTTTTTTTLPPSGSCSDLGESQCIADSSCDWKCNKKNRCSCVDGGGTTTTTLPPSGSCSDNGDQGSCEAAGCNWNSKKSVCR